MSLSQLFSSENSKNQKNGATSLNFDLDDAEDDHQSDLSSDEIQEQFQHQCLTSEQILMAQDLIREEHLLMDTPLTEAISYIGTLKRIIQCVWCLKKCCHRNEQRDQTRREVPEIVVNLIDEEDESQGDEKFETDLGLE